MGSKKKNTKRNVSNGNIFMIISAIAAVIMAIGVMVFVFHKIVSEDFNWQPIETETTPPETIFSIDNDDILGWIKTEEGYKFREDDKSFAADVWKEEDGKLYYIRENELMAVGEMAMDGQIFTFSNEGELLDIEFDSLWQGNVSSPENADSLVISNAYWVYRYDKDNTGDEFLPICYRKAADQEVEYLGSAESPEMTTLNSIQVHDGWIYYLPQKKSNSGYDEYDELDKKLFRMKPGDNSKELIGEEVTGYLVLGQDIYYASQGKIQKASAGIKYMLGDGQYNIIVRDDAFYLTDINNEPVQGNEEGFKTIGDRDYRVEDGEIQYVQPAKITKNGSLYYLQNGVIYKKDSEGNEDIIASCAFGIDSFCISDNWIYYSGYVEKREDNKHYSQLYRVDLEGEILQKLSQKFPGNIQNMYYYKDKRAIYGEYSSARGENALGQIAVISLDGSMSVVDDTLVRLTEESQVNGLMEIVMVKDEAINAYLHTARWNGTQWIFDKREPVQITDRADSRKQTALSVLSGGSDEPMAETEEETEAETETETETTEALEIPETQETPVSPLNPGEAVRPSETIPAPTESTKPSETVPVLTQPEAPVITPIG